MPRWTQEQYEQHQARHAAGRPASGPQPQRLVQNESVATAPGKAQDAKRVRVSITAFRVRRLDPDNACPKYFVDCLRYANFIHDDRDEDIILEIRQEKAASKADERTEITVFKL